MKLSLLGLLLISMNAMAFDKVGNGGDVVICKNPAGAIQSVEFFDHYEARERHKIQVDFGPPQLTVDEKFNLVLQRMERLNPNRALLLKKWYSTFAAESEFLTGVDLLPIPDVGYGFIPAGCEFKQLAVQKDPYFPTDKRYSIDKKFFDLLDRDNQVMFILHELLLREARTQEINPHSNSVNTRYLNAMLSSANIASFTLKRYIDLIQFVAFNKADAQGGVPIIVGEVSPEYYSEDIVKNADFEPNKKFDVTWNSLNLTVELANKSGSSFIPNGQLRDLRRILPNQTLSWMRFGKRFSAMPLAGDPRWRHDIELDNSGEVLIFNSDHYASAVATWEGSESTYRGNCAQMVFDENSKWFGCKNDGPVDYYDPKFSYAGSQIFYQNQWVPGCGYSIFGWNSVRTGISTLFYPDGKPLYFCAAEAIKVSTVLDTFIAKGPVALFENGSLRAVRLDEDRSLLTPSGLQMFKKNSFLQFDKNGLVLRKCDKDYDCPLDF